MPNETTQVSTAAIAELRRREDVALRYYNDAANNCTYGIGTLAHHGPCTEEEMRRSVTRAGAEAQFATRMNEAAATVRQQVRNHQLTQEQFDALVSFTYNLGSTGARRTLNAANRGDFPEVVRHMNSNVYVRLRDAQGRPMRDAQGRQLRPVRVQGLVNRRREEAAPFQVQQADQ